MHPPFLNDIYSAFVKINIIRTPGNNISIVHGPTGYLLNYCNSLIMILRYQTFVPPSVPCSEM